MATKAAEQRVRTSKQPRTREGLGPHSRLLRRGLISGRTREGRFLRAVEAQLAQQLGGRPSFAEKLLISRLARIALRLELFDQTIANGKPLTDLDGRVYNSLLNAFGRLLKTIGIKSAHATEPTLADVLATAKRSREEATAS